MKNFIWACVVVFGLLLAGCTRPVKITWQEEVLLNTGETLLIERSIVWAQTGSYGAPTTAMNPTSDQTLKFSYKGTQYEFTENLLYGWIAISPATGRPVIVGDPVFWQWAFKNDYACTSPSYVQMVPDATGKKWSWPSRIEPWLYLLPANVLFMYPQYKEDRKQLYTRADREIRDKVFTLENPQTLMIDPTYVTKDCPTTDYLKRNPKMGGTIK
jgi:hypothetical protein